MESCDLSEISDCSETSETLTEDVEREVVLDQEMYELIGWMLQPKHFKKPSKLAVIPKGPPASLIEMRVSYEKDIKIKTDTDDFITNKATPSLEVLEEKMEQSVRGTEESTVIETSQVSDMQAAKGPTTIESACMEIEKLKAGVPPPGMKNMATISSQGTIKMEQDDVEDSDTIIKTDHGKLIVPYQIHQSELECITYKRHMKQGGRKVRPGVHIRTQPIPHKRAACLFSQNAHPVTPVCLSMNMVDD